VKNGLLDSVWCAVSGGQVTIEGQTFDIQPFYIAKYLITHIQFQAFLTAKDGYEYDHWWQGLHKDGFKQAMMEQKQRYSNYPRDSISWYQAMAFSRWLNHRLQGQNFRPENTPEQVFMVSQNLEIRLPT
jgi:formylglycine-generating enzyme required for sulfatase activity